MSKGRQTGCFPTLGLNTTDRKTALVDQLIHAIVCIVFKQSVDVK
jgi:hypothetical protein